MKALVKYALESGNMEIRDVPEPVCGSDQVKIQIERAGICGSDLKIYHSEIGIPLNPPVTTGHEFSGTIVEVGSDVKDFKVGEQVVSETAYSYCGICENCSEGYYNLCDQRKTLGYWYNGVFTDYTVVPAARVHRIPKNVSLKAAAMTEPLACVVHAIFDLTVIKPGETVLVSGPGAIGLMALQIAKSFGATVIISGTNADIKRLELAKTLGADYAINVQETNLKDFVLEKTNGLGVDVVLECSGNEFAINAALNVVKKRGYFTLIGMAGKPIEFDIVKINYLEIKLSGSLGSRKDSWRKSLKLLEEGAVQLEPLIDVELPLSDWEEAFNKFEAKEGIKFMLVPEIAQK